MPAKTPYGLVPIVIIIIFKIKTIQTSKKKIHSALTECFKPIIVILRRLKKEKTTKFSFRPLILGGRSYFQNNNGNLYGIYVLLYE